MGFLEMNLANLGNINRTTGRMADRAFSASEARKARTGQGLGNIAGMIFGSGQAKKLADAKALEADKGRTAQNRAAARLADERGGVRDWERDEGFKQTKELEKLRADSRAALARLEASFRKDGDTGDFDIDEAFTRVMSYAVLGRAGEEWSQSWQPNEWTQEEKDRMLQKISQRISQYGEDGAAVQSMVDSYLAEFDYLFPPIASEGVDTGGGFFDRLFTAGSGESLGGAAGLARLQAQKETTGFTTPLDGVTPGVGENAQDWTIMQSLLRQIAGDPNKMKDPTVKMHLKDARDGTFQQSTGLEDFIRVLKRLGAVEDTTPQVFN